MVCSSLRLGRRQSVKPPKLALAHASIAANHVEPPPSAAILRCHCSPLTPSTTMPPVPPSTIVRITGKPTSPSSSPPAMHARAPPSGARQYRDSESPTARAVHTHWPFSQNACTPQDVLSGEVCVH